MAWGILLAGGRSSRMGTDKLDLTREGRTLAQRGVDALLSVADVVVVASPHREGFDDPRVEFVLEDPPFGGPVAGIAAALEWLPEGDVEVYLLAGDLADPAPLVALLASGVPGEDGLALVDEEGWPQYLAGRYRASALRRVVSGEVRDRSVHRTFRPLRLALAPVVSAMAADVDTPEQARHAGIDPTEKSL